MENEHLEHIQPGSEESDKLAWQEPKLSFVEPKLTQHGKLEQVTGAITMVI